MTVKVNEVAPLIFQPGVIDTLYHLVACIGNGQLFKQSWPVAVTIVLQCDITVLYGLPPNARHRSHLEVFARGRIGDTAPFIIESLIAVQHCSTDICLELVPHAKEMQAQGVVKFGTLREKAVRDIHDSEQGVGCRRAHAQ